MNATEVRAALLSTIEQGGAAIDGLNEVLDILEQIISTYSAVAAEVSHELPGGTGYYTAAKSRVEEIIATLQQAGEYTGHFQATI